MGSVLSSEFPGREPGIMTVVIIGVLENASVDLLLFLTSPYDWLKKDGMWLTSDYHFEIMVHAWLRFKDPSPGQEGDGIVFHIFQISEESFKTFILGPFTTAARQRRRCNLMSEPLRDHKLQGMENNICEINAYFKIYFLPYTML